MSSELQKEHIYEEPKNKGFKLIHNKFTDNNFELTRNEDTALIYSSKNNQYDEIFELFVKGKLKKNLIKLNY